MFLFDFFLHCIVPARTRFKAGWQIPLGLGMNLYIAGWVKRTGCLRNVEIACCDSEGYIGGLY